MLHFDESARIFLKPGATDMRKSINGLIPIIQKQMKKNSMDSSYYVFCNRTKHLLKILYWDKTGFALWQKRLEKARFPWPESILQIKEISPDQVRWLLQGIDFFRAHEELKFSVGF